MSIAIVLFVTLFSAVALATLLILRRRKPAKPFSAESPVYNVEIAPAADSKQEIMLLCPHCAFEGTLEDLSLVGQNVDCPLCRQTFTVLEPEFATTG